MNKTKTYFNHIFLWKQIILVIRYHLDISNRVIWHWLPYKLLKEIGCTRITIMYMIFFLTVHDTHTVLHFSWMETRIIFVCRCKLDHDVKNALALTLAVPVKQYQYSFFSIFMHVEIPPKHMENHFTYFSYIWQNLKVFADS